MQDTSKAYIERLLRTFQKGDRVKATVYIVLGTGEEVPEGTEGTVIDGKPLGTTGLTKIKWVNGVMSITSNDCIDKVDA